MEMIPAPLRVFKTYSFWVTIVAGILDIIYASFQTAQQLINPNTVVILNIAFLAAIAIVKFIKQSIALTEIQKEDLKEHIESVPTKPIAIL